MDEGAEGPDDRSDDAGAAAAAQGWSRIQLAVLAFIGLCGVITDGRPELPRWLQTTAAVLSLLALSLACAAVYVVTSVAWPLSSPGAGAPVDPASTAPDLRRRLRAGAALTFVAVAVMALAASTNWWPVGSDRAATGSAGGDAAVPPLVEAIDRDANQWCGRLLASDRGAVLIATGAGSTELALRSLAALSPVERR